MVLAKSSLPNKLFDYIHAGTAVLVSPLVEVKRIIENNTIGHLLSSREPEMVAKQIVEMHEKINSFEFTKAKKELDNYLTNFHDFPLRFLFITVDIEKIYPNGLVLSDVH